VTIKKKGVLPSDAAAKVMQLRGQIKQQYQSMAVTLDDYTAAPDRKKTVDIYPEEAGPAFENAPPHDDDDLPFA